MDKNEEIKTISESEYPVEWKDLRGFPKSLKYRGQYSEGMFKKCMAVIGSRDISEEGREKTREAVRSLVSRGICVVSGFAAGTDSVAHRECVESSGRTVAVLGCGLDVVYPKENRSLYDDIIKRGGLIMSEYDKDFTGTRWSYPRRNKVVAAISNLGIIVIEAGMKSGTMNTVKEAIKLERKIWVWDGGSRDGNKYLIENKIGIAFNRFGDF